MKSRTIIFNTMLTVIVIFSLTGCAGKQVVSSPPVSLPVYKEVMEDYYLQPGDSLDIKFIYNTELDENVIIRPDGRISLKMIDEVMAAGLTPSQLDQLLTDKYSSQLRKADITVIVRDFEGQKIYVGGSVINPGLIKMQGRLSVLGAIMQAGGFDMRTAAVNNVVIIRHQNDKRSGFLLNCKDFLKGKEGKPFYLAPYDIVYVPQTTIAGINQWIDQHITQLVTLAGFRYTKMGRSYSYGVDTSRD